MKILRDPHNLPDAFKGAVYAIGNFDGIHRGHRAVIDAAASIADKSADKSADKKTPLAIITFEPHSRNFFHPDQPRARLTPVKIKAELMQQMNVDVLLNLRFNRKLASLSADDFVKDILHQQLAAAHIAVGENFRFGAKRHGDAQFLFDAGKKIGFGVDIIKPVQTGDGAISSTAIRSALSEGRVETAARLLGRWWQITGKVRRGEQRGRKLGFPTLNLALKHYAPLALGVYAARCRLGGKTFDAVINVGVRPTFGDGKTPLLEAHLLGTEKDFPQNGFYGAHARIFPLHFMRAEKRFESLDALKAQIQQDCAAAQKLCQEINAQNTFEFQP